MVQVDLDYTGAGGKREKEKTEESKEMPMIGDGDLLEMENEKTTGRENWTPRKMSKKKEEGYGLLVKERRVKVIIIIKN